MRLGRVTFAWVFQPGKQYVLVFILRTKLWDGGVTQEEEEESTFFSPFLR